eukprot:TRINITY_DN23879_c0_g1_i1.p1 TRINITY_DN23879_c0_g1~~TRINITY_DN23879_c0_g1_i1.p1  ORF type:complete len:189 (-),score=35.52 TRINITY_DN23879_c0_g1_i1:99-626(-)
MESKPLSELTSEGFGARSSTSRHPLSTAMSCVMALTVVYFGAYLILMTWHLLRVSSSWTAAAVASLQRSLAFAPMLCVMMIAVRLRAMQIGVRDPPLWAQNSMIVTTAAVITQVVCSLLGEGQEQELEDKGEEPWNLASKFGLITLIVLRYTATAILFLGVGSLIISLAWMQPIL